MLTSLRAVIVVFEQAVVTPKPCPELPIVPHRTLTGLMDCGSATNTLFEVWRDGFLALSDHMISQIQLPCKVNSLLWRSSFKFNL